MIMFEVRYLVAAPITVVMLIWFIVLAMLDRAFGRVALFSVFLPLSLPFVVLDVIYNLIIGTWLFLDAPREWLFTDRLKRYQAQDMWLDDRFVLVLNAVDEGHV
jgi:hypothetical protein